MGDFFALDEQGFVRNRCRSHLIANSWRPLIREVINIYRRRVADCLIGVYLRGSVPAGTAVARVSDLDSFALLEWDPGKSFRRWEALADSGPTVQQLCVRYPVAQKVELMVAHHDPSVPGQNPRIKALLRTQSLCVWGKDVTGEMPPVRPGPALRHHYRWLGKDLAAAKMAPMGDWEPVRQCMKTVIRTGMELVMDRLGAYATDLYPCWRAFSQLYPDRETAMAEAIHVYLDPPALWEKHRRRVLQLAEWLHDEVARQNWG